MSDPTFEQGLRQGRAEVLRWLRERHGGFVYADDYEANNADKIDPCEHDWQLMPEKWNKGYEECLKCMSTRKAKP